MSTRTIYLDHHATTPVDPRVAERMWPYFCEEFGNAASRNHVYGWNAEAAVENAREQVARLIGASRKEIVWTSGATEANNLAILGAAEASRDHGDHVVTCVTEHPAVLDPVRELERRGFRVTRLPVDEGGRLDPDELRSALEKKTVLVSIMAANNEIGVIHPIGEIAGIVHEGSRALFHTDAVQAAGKIPLDVEEMGIDLLSVSGHKVYGPKGVGALYVRRRRPQVRLVPILYGGGHERGMRSGTLNVPGIVGMGEAFEIAAQEMERDHEHTRTLRDRLESRLTGELEEVTRNGDSSRRLPNNSNLSFRWVEAEELLKELDGIAVSTGAACSSASLDPSHVIAALGVGEERAQSSIRFGLGRFNTAEEIEWVAERVITAVKHLRAGSPRPVMARSESGGPADDAPGS